MVSVLLSLTLMYGAAARCKRLSSVCRFAVLHQCIRPLVGACGAPGHHGYQRAYVLISRQTSSGPFGSPGFACAVKTDPPSRLNLSQTSAGIGTRCYLIAVSLSVQFLCSCQKAVPSSRPAVAAGRRAQGLSRLAGLRPPTGLGLDGSEHGATLMQVGTPWRASSRIRRRAPC